MRSLVVSHDATLGEGGQGAHLETLVEALAADFDLTGYCRAGGASSGLENVEPPRIAVGMARVPVLRRLRDWQVLHEASAFDRKVARRLAEADVFHGVAGQCATSLERAHALGMRTVLDALNPHVGHFANLDDAECKYFGMRPLLHPTMRRRMQREYDLADLIRVESSFSRETFIEHGIDPHRVVAVRPAIDAGAFVPAQATGGPLRILFVGLMQPWKGFRYLIDAFDALGPSDSELVIWGGVGARPVARYLAERCRRNLRIKLRSGDLRRLGYAEAYGGASVLVHPSLAEGWGYVVSEAMASGLPVIATSWTGAAELIEDGRNGYVVPPQDSDAIAERLRHLALHPDLLRKMGAAARQTAESLSVEALRKAYVPVIDGSVSEATIP